MRILVIAPSWLGDLVMSQSLYKAIKKANPDATIDLYALKWMFPIIKRMDEVNNVIENPFAHGSFDFLKRKNEGMKLRSKYDKAIILPNSWKSALVPFFAGVKERCGFIGESRYFLLNDYRNNKKDFPLMVERYSALAFSKDSVKTAQDLPNILYPSLKTQEPSCSLLEKLNLSLSRPLLALGCGANYGPSKLWPPAYFAEVADKWIEKGGAVLGIGSKNDIPTVNKIKERIDVRNLSYFYDIAGKTNLVEALDLTAKAAAAVCNDSGLMHLVAAVGVPQVAIFGSTSTGYTPPLSDRAVCLESDEPCHPCFERTCKFKTYACLKKITPNLVIEQLAKLTGI